MTPKESDLDRRNFIRTLATVGMAAGALTLAPDSTEAAGCPKLPKARGSKNVVPVHIVSEVGDVMDGQMDLGTVVQDFTSAEGRSMSFELFFDTFEDQTDVHSKTDPVLNLALVDQQLHRPPTALITWGNGLSFKCTVESAHAGFSLFLDGGTPVRGIVRMRVHVLAECTAGPPGTP